MSQKIDQENIFDEINNFTTFKNNNNFDDYFALVLPKLSK